jgi:leucyl aminopeptidase
MHITTHTSTRLLPKKHFVSIELAPERDHTTFVDGADGTQHIVLGTKALTPLTRRRFVTLVRRIVQAAKTHHIRRVSLSLETIMRDELDVPVPELLRILAENVHLADYDYTVYKKRKDDDPAALEVFALIGTFDAAMKTALKTGALVAQETNACRDLSNTPGGDMTPALLARQIVASARGTAAKVTVLTKRAMENLGMGAVLGVARGALEDPRFIIVEYRGATSKQQPIVLVGKGVTFDTGGLSLKPADYMLDMHLDMSGGAAVAHAVIAAARLKLKVNAVALIPAVENAVSGESYRPGDVLRSMSGTTIDILNTDAEGRVILADALTYARRYKPSLVVDVATLTGAALVALGTQASAVLSRDDALATRLCALGEVSGDYLWPLPLWEEYKPMIKGRFGDIANIPIENARYAGTIGGGMFLAEFADEYPWAHIDIAPRMTSDKGDHLSQGAAGAPVRLLVRLLEDEQTLRS